MADYNSAYSGAQIDDAVRRAIGFGLGSIAGKFIPNTDNLDNYKESGWYYWNNAPTNAPGAYMNMEVSAFTSTYIVQQVVQIGDGIVKYRIRSCYYGTWSDWQDWANVLGVAPAGFGLGVTDLEKLSNVDLNTVLKSGAYAIYSGCTNWPENVPQYSFSILKVSTSRSDLLSQQDLILGGGGYQGYILRRTSTSGSSGWKPWEWVDPPMHLGVEYRTTERYLGKPVYAKLVDCGAMPNASKKTVSTGVTGTSHLVSWFVSTSTQVALPYADTDGNAEWSMRVKNINPSQVTLETTVNYSALSAFAYIKYTKTTD